MSTNEFCLNFCDQNIKRFGREAYQTFRADQRVIVDEPPSCQTFCFECQYCPLAIYGVTPDRDNAQEDRWEFLQAGTIENPGTTADLIELINRRLLENSSL